MQRFGDGGSVTHTTGGGTYTSYGPGNTVQVSRFGGGGVPGGYVSTGGSTYSSSSPGGGTVQVSVSVCILFLYEC